MVTDQQVRRLMSLIKKEKSVLAEKRIDTADLVSPVYQTCGKWWRHTAFEFSDRGSLTPSHCTILVSLDRFLHLQVYLRLQIWSDETISDKTPFSRRTESARSHC
jgi:hypothetical protein